jgi:uncharacterized repeat protein (TIGR02543 family)
MKTIAKGVAVATSLAFLVSLMTCSNIFAPAKSKNSASTSSRKAKLTLSFLPQRNSRTVVPNVGAQISSYGVTLTSHNGYTAITQSGSATSMTITSIPVGTWDIAVAASNGTAIVGQGSLASQSIQANQTLSVSIPIVTSQIATGNFSFTLQWPVSTGVNYVSGQLTQPSGTVVGSAMVPSVTTTTVNSTTYEQAVFAQTGATSGAYLLQMTFKRGGSSGTPAALITESINIFDNLTSDQWIDPATGNFESARTLAATEFSSSNASLSNLVLTGSALAMSPGFSSTTLSYTANTTGASLTISPTESQTGQGIAYSTNGTTWTSIGSGGVSTPVSLTVGANTLYVRVTAADQTTQQTYTVTVTELVPYSVTYNANGGTPSTNVPSTSFYTIGQTVSVSGNTGGLSNAGYTFAGWTTSITGPGSSYAAAATFTMGSGNVTLYAVWIPSSLSFTSSGDIIILTTPAPTSLTGSLTIPIGVTEIGPSVFESCTGLTSITIPSSVIGIDTDAFDSCSGLTSLTIPSSVTTIGDFAFMSCIGLTSLNIPSSVSSLGLGICSYCPRLTAISVDSSNPNYTSVSGVLYNKTKTTLMEWPEGLSGSCTILSSVNQIASYAFWGCSGLTGSLIIPSSVTSIGIATFSGCAGFTGSLSIPSGVTSIGQEGFAQCDGFTSLSLPSSITSIDVSTFYNCTGLTTVSLPGSLTSIGTDAFMACTNLSGVYVQATTPPTLPSGSQAFDNCAAGLQIYIPGSSLAAYQAATGWISYASFMVPAWVDLSQQSGNSATSGKPWRSIASSADGTHLVAVASGVDIWTSTNSGASWVDESQQSGNSATKGLNWYAIASSADGTNLAAVVFGGDIWTSSTSGASWVDESQQTGNSATKGLNWSSIASSSDGTHLAAVVSGGDIWTSTTSGASWVDESLLTVNLATSGRAWLSIASSSDGSHLAAVSNGGDIWTSTTSGASWLDQSQQTGNSATIGLDWFAIASSSDGSHLAAVANSGDIWTSTTSGASWVDESQQTGNSATSGLNWYAIASSADGTHLAAVAYGGDIWTSTTSGASWVDQSKLAGDTATSGLDWISIASSSDGTHLAATVYPGDIWTGP